MQGRAAQLGRAQADVREGRFDTAAVANFAVPGPAIPGQHFCESGHDFEMKTVQPGIKALLIAGSFFF